MGSRAIYLWTIIDFLECFTFGRIKYGCFIPHLFKLIATTWDALIPKRVWHLCHTYVWIVSLVVTQFIANECLVSERVRPVRIENLWSIHWILHLSIGSLLFSRRSDKYHQLGRLSFSSTMASIWWHANISICMSWCSCSASCMTRTRWCHRSLVWSKGRLWLEVFL